MICIYFRMILFWQKALSLRMTTVMPSDWDRCKRQLQQWDWSHQVIPAWAVKRVSRLFLTPKMCLIAWQRLWRRSWRSWRSRSVSVCLCLNTDSFTIRIRGWTLTDAKKNGFRAMWTGDRPRGTSASPPKKTERMFSIHPRIRETVVSSFLPCRFVGVKGFKNWVV